MKAKLIPLQAMMWTRRGKKVKQIKFGAVRKVADIWTPHRISARTLRNNKMVSLSIFEFSDLRYGDPRVKDADFTTRRLEQGL